MYVKSSSQPITGEANPASYKEKVLVKSLNSSLTKAGLKRRFR